jgi:hypothetical protein
VRVQPVVAHADAEPDADPIEQNRYDESVPAEHKQRSDGAHVQNNQNADDGPVQLPVFVDTMNFVRQEVS